MEQCIFSNFQWLLLVLCFKIVNTDLYVHLQGSNSCDCVHQRLSCFTCNQYCIHPYTARRNIHKVYLPNLPSYLKKRLRGMGTREGKQCGLVQTTKDFSTQTSVKGGVTYVFDRKKGLFDLLLWPFVILGFLTVAIFLLQVSFRGLKTVDKQIGMRKKQ